MIDLRKKSGSEDDRRPKRLFRVNNTLVVGLFAGCMIGFLLAMFAGAFDVGMMKEVPPWLQGVFSGLATLVSVYAVYLVSQTLQATRDTLTATSQMAEEQKKLGDAQTRAWVLVDSYEATEDGNDLIIAINFKNYGITPATNVILHPKIINHTWEEVDAETGAGFEYISGEEQLRYTSVTTLPPNAIVTIRDRIYLEKEIHADWRLLEIKLAYRTVHQHGEDDIIVFDIDENERVKSISLR